MIRAERRPRPKCTCGFCHVCSDDLVRFWAEANRNGGWPSADLAGGATRRTVTVGSLAATVRLNEPSRTPVPLNVAGFEAHFAALKERLGRG